MTAHTDRAISLFLPFYTPKDASRADELLACLRRNLDCDVFDRIFLLQDDNSTIPFDDDRLRVLRLSQRPTYLDWVRQSHDLCPNHISVLANSDIYFDADIARLQTLFDERASSFVSLSRYDWIDGTPQPHPNPHWSQDTWAFLPSVPVSPEMARALDIPLGVPRCDNKVAYVFSINGYTVVNPFYDIRSIHVHETGLRYYDKTGDTSIKGGMAMVHPSETLISPAPLDIEIWSLNSAQYAKPTINRSLERWRDARDAATDTARRIFAHDNDWQYPAITEKHAHRRMVAAADAGQTMPEGTAYLGFPWATLIDLSTHARNRSAKTDALKVPLARFRTTLAGYDRVITVCQHIRLPEYTELLTSAGVTDVFWSHCRRDMTHMPGQPDIAVHPFPLYPVQQVPVAFTDLHAPRPLLFSFAGARSSDIYLSQVRNQIIDHLASDSEGEIIDRSAWHYQRIVYDKQILDRAPEGVQLEDQSAAEQFRALLNRSLFTLCPSGTGPNSIRLWEAALAGSIPVVLSDQYAPPRDLELWDLATVSCAETQQALIDLPDRLRALRDDPAALARKQIALYLLVQKYGPKNFVNDILALD
ncbi:exostosin family protein [Tateyamaria sp. SN6-1]|uniref:exostosin domain-containing protein n=1 Tax=Tateyamaria sp. SN6-1 TaxID=3092148 RepID=UPI0039F492EC